jgi:hypothetical protein
MYFVSLYEERHFSFVFGLALETGKSKGKGKIGPITCHESTERE